jgi:hypothetical protein
VAYTFITPDEENYAEDIKRVLELSNQPIPEELKNLVKSFKEKIHSGSIMAYRHGGFGGRGKINI